MTCSRHIIIRFLSITSALASSACAGTNNSDTATASEPVTLNNPVKEEVMQNTQIAFMLSQTDPSKNPQQLFYIAISKEMPAAVKQIYADAFNIALKDYVDRFNTSTDNTSKIMIPASTIRRMAIGEGALSIPFDSIISAALSGSLEDFTASAMPEGFEISDKYDRDSELAIKIRAVRRAISECPDTVLSAELAYSGIALKLPKETPYATAQVLFDALREGGLPRFALTSDLRDN